METGLGNASKGHVALIRGPIVSTLGSVNNEPTPSIAFAYIAAYLMAKGYQVTIIDAIAEGIGRRWPLDDYPGFQCQGLPFDEILAAVPADVTAIGFSVMFSGEWPVARDLIKKVRERFPDAFFVAGGEHATALSEYSLRNCPALDVIVRGEGEHTLYELLEARAEGRDLATISGLSFLDADDTYVETEGLPRIRELGEMPWPYWPEGYMEKFWSAGKSYGVQTLRDMPMMLSRGCPFRCRFCSSPTMWTTRYILRDIEDVIAEIKHYVKVYGITAIQLYDLTAITKKSWAMAFLERLAEENISLKWSLPSGTRSEALDEELLARLSRTGCNYLVYAPESGSQRTLERLDKRIALDKIDESMMTAKKLGLTLRANIIIGFPFESKADVLRSLWYGFTLAARGVDEVAPNIFSPYPGTSLFRELVAEGRVSISDDYFLALSSLNSAYFRVNPMTVCTAFSPMTLAILRVSCTLLNYGIGYLLFPSRIVRFFRSLSKREAATVFEHRLRQLLVGGRAE